MLNRDSDFLTASFFSIFYSYLFLPVCRFFFIFHCKSNILLPSLHFLIPLGSKNINSPNIRIGSLWNLLATKVFWGRFTHPKIIPPENKRRTMEHSNHEWRCISSEKWWFSIVMLVLGRVSYVATEKWWLGVGETVLSVCEAVFYFQALSHQTGKGSHISIPTQTGSSERIIDSKHKLGEKKDMLI